MSVMLVSELSGEIFTVMNPHSAWLFASPMKPKSTLRRSSDRSGLKDLSRRVIPTFARSHCTDKCSLRHHLAGRLVPLWHNPHLPVTAARRPGPGPKFGNYTQIAPTRLMLPRHSPKYLVRNGNPS
jgi:hypothetical protein